MRVAVAGHRWNRIDPETEGKHLAALLRSAMEALSGSDGSVTLVTGMAEGTDLTAAEVRPAHWRLEAALALPEPCWRDHLDKATGVRPEDLNIAQLLARVEAGGVDEVVLAMNATLEGQTTAHYLAERLEEHPVRITQLAHGLPVGGELDYLDEGTLAQALRARRPLG